MLDLKFVRDNIDAVRANTVHRHVSANPDLVVELYDRRNGQLKELETLRASRNSNAEKMKTKLSPEDRARLIEEGKRLKESIAKLEKSYEETEQHLTEEALRLPNMSHPDAPVAEGETGNRQLRTWGVPTSFSFPHKDHVEIGQSLDLVDFESGAKVAGQKFYYLKNEAVILELALVRYAMDVLIREGFTPFMTPDVAREDIVAGHGFNPRGPESNIYTLEGTDLCLVATAEFTLGGLNSGKILAAEALPITFAGVSHCFRREAGAAGQFSKGLYRVHQFTKVEMYVFCHPSGSEAMLDRLIGIEEKIFQGLEVPYRIVDTCTGDLGGPAYRKFDIEAWMPGRGEKGEWGEITSASNCTDYQARRLGIRFKEGGKNAFVHTLNGTALAVSRTLIALLENFQKEDGTVMIPQALAAYTGFDRVRPRHARQD
ncbi:MAG TPA: serine--tRNA ligase [Spirochaetia bacterium]|nr:serine--tRNA ligase [Spirochaetia bacterium]